MDTPVIVALISAVATIAATLGGILLSDYLKYRHQKAHRKFPPQKNNT